MIHLRRNILYVDSFMILDGYMLTYSSNDTFYLKVKMIDYKLVEKYKSYNIFIGDVSESSEIKKDNEGSK